MNTNNENEDAIRQVLNKLKPGFEDYQKHKDKNLGLIIRPIIHGTGSLALKSILTNGIMVRSSSQVMVGERAAMSQGNIDIKPISFAQLDSEGNGESTAHFYALLAAGKPELILDEAQIKHQTLAENYISHIGQGALEYGIRKKFEKEQAESLPDDNPELSLDWIRKDAKQKFRLLSNEGAYCFNSDRQSRNIEELQKIINGEYDNPELLGNKLLELGLVADIRYYYHPKGTPPEPWSKLPELLKIAVEEVRNPKSVIGRNFRAKLQLMRQKLTKFKDMTPKEQREITDQFPCVFLLEGDGLNLEEVNWMVTCQELHSKQNIEPKRIRQIRVPLIHTEQVIEMLAKAGLSNVEVIPFEYYEMEKLLEDDR